MSTILITGATSGLGRHVAFELVRSGHVVLAHGRDPGRTEHLVEELVGLCRRRYDITIEEVRTTEEHVVFKLPRELVD